VVGIADTTGDAPAAALEAEVDAGEHLEVWAAWRGVESTIVVGMGMASRTRYRQQR